MFASLRLRQANLATIVEWIEIHFDIYIIMIINSPIVVQYNTSSIAIKCTPINYTVYTALSITCLKSQKQAQ